MDYTHPQYWPQLQGLANNIDNLDYFQILNVPVEASGAQIRDSYYALARALHPDKFFQIADEVTKAAVHKIYKRVTESYTILKDERRRIKYQADVQGPERIKKLRFTEESEAEQNAQQKAATKVAKTPKGEQMYNSAVVDMANQRWAQAYKNVQTALMFEPQNAELKKLLDDLDKKRKGLV